MVKDDNREAIARLQQLTALYDGKGQSKFYRTTATLQLDYDEEHYVNPKKQHSVGGTSTLLLAMDTIFRIRILPRTGALTSDVYLNFKDDCWYHLLGNDAEIMTKIEAAAEHLSSMQ